MVQLQNPDRLTQTVKFGTIEDSEDINGAPSKEFSQIGKPTLCGRWSLSTNQIVQMAGMQQNESIIIVVHHRENWSSITHAMYSKELYRVTNINQDPYRNPTAYDLVTLTKASDANG